MKTSLGASTEGALALPILALSGADAAADGDPAAAGLKLVRRAREFAEPLLSGELLDTGEPALEHADGTASILRGIGAAPSLAAAAYLVYAGDFLNKPEDTLGRQFGSALAELVAHTRKLVQLQRAAREARVSDAQRAEQTERVRKMLLAFSRDLRVVLLRLSSRLQTLRWHAQARRECPLPMAEESQQIFAPLASRLGIWQIKWEIEDLAFRFLQPDAYRTLARQLSERRLAREEGVDRARQQLGRLLAEGGVPALVQGRPKHLYSIWKKMQGKHLPLERVFDLRALRVIVADVPACYAALAVVHARFEAVPGEYDDYIARPKPNGYQSLHTVVWLDEARSQPAEIQIRTQAMHDHAELGVAAHWAYKEAGTRGYAGVSVEGGFEERVAEARKAVLRQLLAWERDFVDQASQAQGGGPALFDDRIYVFTPQAAVVELAAGATPIDFAYALHTDLGHRCRGAKVDGVMVPLSTGLANGQTVEVIAAKEGGPSLDWINPELGYLKSPRARAKVRAWFNARAQAGTIAKGREQVEKLLQRMGRTAVRLDDLAGQLGFRDADALFEVVGKDEFSLKTIETLLRGPAEGSPEAGAGADEAITLQPTRARPGGVLVVGVDSLLTQLARCCRPAPPDEIEGYVTRGRGVAVHRARCSNLRHMAQRQPERVIAVDWGEGVRGASGHSPVYPVDVVVDAADRSGLLRDVADAFTKARLHVTDARSQTHRGPDGATVQMRFTVEVPGSDQLDAVLRTVQSLPGVRQARRR